MFETINIDSSIAVYVQIENQVQFAIASSQLKAGERLPSVRELSERLGLNPNTVAKAYRDLEVMGYLWTRRGMGIFVQKGVEAKCRDTVRRRIVTRFHEVVAEAKAAGMAAGEVKDLTTKCYASDAGPYGETPSAVLALAKPKRD